MQRCISVKPQAARQATGSLDLFTSPGFTRKPRVDMCAVPAAQLRPGRTGHAARPGG